ncbi:MAG: TetR/AcrR family transcriptional regulator [Actinomycetota bacterium]|nr:TetR/AcrR family transcriptional regulator [Actinomycetota bacterium]
MSDVAAPLPLDPSDSQGPPKPLRADARRNRERVLNAAREIFAEQGRDAQIDDVARRAGLGVGTVYRHFPTKEALLEALAIDKFERLLVIAERALDASDAWEGLRDVFWKTAEQMEQDRALSEAMAPDALEVATAERVRLQDAGRLLLERAQKSGAVRADVEPEDLPVLMCSIGAAVRRSAGNPERWHRYVELVCDGLRARTP